MVQAKFHQRARAIAQRFGPAMKYPQSRLAPSENRLGNFNQDYLGCNRSRFDQPSILHLISSVFDELIGDLIFMSPPTRSFDMHFTMIGSD
jgi:hypothetical protein